MLYVYIRRDEDQRMTTAGRGKKNKPAHMGGGGGAGWSSALCFDKQFGKKDALRSKKIMFCLGFLKKYC